MTGYARARSENEMYAAEIELRSVNHRYQDIRVKIPTAFASYEKSIRDDVASFVSRGKVDVTIRVGPKAESLYELEIDRPLMKNFIESARNLASELGIRGELGVSDLVAFSPAFKIQERDLTGGEPLRDALRSALEQALQQHRGMREDEGRELAKDLDARIAGLARALDAIERLSFESRERRRRELTAKIEELARGSLEPGTLAMEVARLVERADITEELTRFRSHLSLWGSTVSEEGPCGKKLDFILQEMNREANTVGAKCQDAAISEHVISIKAELERIREQVQNVE